MKGIVLLSGGIDSTTCLAVAIKNLGAENVVALSVLYGQKHNKELQCSKNVCEHYGVKQYTIDLSTSMQFSDCSLLKHSSKDIRHESYKEQIDKDGEGMVETYVPFRNGLLLSEAAALAMSLFPKERTKIYLGAHADDAAGEAYADCSYQFMYAMNKAINIGTYGNVQISAPFTEVNKAVVVKIGLELKVPYELTWSCYEGGEKACGTCGTCIDRKAAFTANGTEDPIEYERL